VPDPAREGETCGGGDRCIENPTCAGGQCDGFAKVCASGPCTPNSRCNPVTGACEYDLPPDGEACTFLAEECPCGQICECQQFNTAGICLFAACKNQ
jgi:hypothetical protein